MGLQQNWKAKSVITPCYLYWGYVNLVLIFVLNNKVQLPIDKTSFNNFLIDNYSIVG